MASIVKLSVDAAVYEHASIMWENLVGLPPEKVVYRLSAGEGLVSEVDRLLVDNLNEFLHRVDRFVPRVRLNVPGGDIYSVRCNTLIARWRRRLSSVRSGMLKSNKPVYLTDAVNAIITKPCNDEIARLRKSISAELELQKSGQELTPEQQQRVDEVNAKIEEQKIKLRKLPRCNNIILTAMLHEVIDRMPQEERDELAQLEEERTRNRKELEDVIAELKDVRLSLGSNSKYAGEGEKESLEKRLPELEEKCMIMDADYDVNKQRRAEILQKYYDHIKPEVVAEALMEAPYTFWERFNMSKVMKEVNVRVASATKSSRRTKSDDVEKSAPKRKRKQSSIEEHAADLMLFPFSFGDADTGDIRSQLAEDNMIMDEYDEWTEQCKDISLTAEYRAKYEEFCRRFNTIPDSALKVLAEGQAFTVPSRESKNLAKLKDFLFSISTKSEQDEQAIEDNKEDIKAVCEFDDFEAFYDEMVRASQGTGINSPLRYILKMISNHVKEQSDDDKQ